MLAQVPRDTTKEYWDRTSEYTADTLYHVHVSDFGFDPGATTKDVPFATTIEKLASEMDRDGFVTVSEPMRSFTRVSHEKDPHFFLGHIKGMARITVPIACLLHCKLNSLEFPITFPKLFHTLRCITVAFENHANLQSVALRSAQLSGRGAIRKAYCAVTWMGALNKLSKSGSDPTTVLKLHNQQASSGSQIVGAKRVSVLNLLSFRVPTREIILRTVSLLNAEGSPWTDECWANKKIVPGYTCRTNDQYGQRLSITEDSFELMVKLQGCEAQRKMPQLRRKCDAKQMEETSQVCALLLSLCNDCKTLYPIDASVIQKDIIDVFARGDHAELLVMLQGILHSKPDALDLKTMPLFSDIITSQVASADTHTFGIEKTSIVNAEIERSEWELFKQKLSHDIQAATVYQRRCRTDLSLPKR